MKRIALLSFFITVALRANADETMPGACALHEGEIVTEAQVRDVAQSWGGSINLLTGDNAAAIVAALDSPYLPNGLKPDALIVFEAKDEAKDEVRIFFMLKAEAGLCVRAATIVPPNQWERALRRALGDSA